MRECVSVVIYACCVAPCTYKRVSTIDVCVCVCVCVCVFTFMYVCIFGG
jgi:hypothetical protein